MQKINLWSFLNHFEFFLNKSVLNGKYWKFKTVIFSCIFTFSLLFVFNRGYIFENFRSFYADVLLHNPQPFFFWNSIIEQGENPLKPVFHASGSHEANRTFRLTMPLISRYLHLNSLGLYLLQIVLGFGFLYLLINILNKILDDKILVCYLFLSFLNVYTGSSFFLNCFGHGDGYTFFFILCALLVRNPLIFSFFLQMAFWCDERSVITSLGIWGFQYVYYQFKKKESILTISLIITNVLIYIAIRTYLSSNFHLVSEDVETSTWARYYSFIYTTSLWYGKRSYVGLEGFSLFTFLALAIFYIDKKYTKILLSIAYWLPILAISFLVGDTVRTLSFTFVFWLISLIVIKDRIERTQMKALLIVVAFINLMIPVIFP
jgi:hypothetical protein